MLVTAQQIPDGLCNIIDIREMLHEFIKFLILLFLVFLCKTGRKRLSRIDFETLTTTTLGQ